MRSETASLPQLPDLSGCLQHSFGFARFRANQEAVCRAVVSGRDVLLVMPTGSGKSLCYQLPTIVRGGTGLVVSPLIALMEDQSSRLRARGFRAERIHSGLDRGAARHACIDYLNGKLDFLFIAPERLRVPGFPEMLAKRKPALIAVDEAHCISQWGHDFRPDYRMLQGRLAALRPAPVIALTATATQVVQQDIVNQLGLQNPALFIHGFRRHNLAIEVVRTPLAQRAELASALLRRPGRLPAIVYVPTRKQADALTVELSAHVAAAAYHAGLDPATRDQAQEAFLLGKLDVVVATIAFGMGIDKPNVRTVIHTALPMSIEGYYQEIGRAGRDGLPSRAILMHSFADQKTREFFLDHNYPPIDELDAVFRKLTASFRERQEISAAVEADAEAFEKSIERLAIYGGAILDSSGNLRRGDSHWREAYAAQAVFRRAEAERVARFAESDQCRMAAIVRHFGDLEDAGEACGVCDYCDPDGCLLQEFRQPTRAEIETVVDVKTILYQNQPTSTGRLYQQACPSREIPRREFEQILGAMARSGMVKIEETTFEKDGKTIPFRKVRLAEAGMTTGAATAATLRIKCSLFPAPDGGKAKSKRTASAPKLRPVAPAELSPEARKLAERLKQWRRSEAQNNRMPAYIVLSDRAIQEIAMEKPSTLAELAGIHGIGPAKQERYGATILKLCATPGNEPSL